MVLPGLGRRLRRRGLHVVRAFDLADPANEDGVEPGLLFDLAHGGLLDGLALLDAPAGNDCRELRKVEDQELVGARLRVLARDVDGNRRAGSQLFWARILAL
jgi:hypothetical protein